MNRKKFKICIILGTRPEIIKMFPIVLECEKRKLNYFILHAGQHYVYELDKIFFDEFNCPSPKYNLKVGSGTHAEQIGSMLPKIEAVLKKEKPSICLVEGDTNTVLAGALVSSRLGISIGHVEAGLRSFNHEMPEEINRLLTDHMSDLLFAPTEYAKKNLTREGIAKSKIFVTGNTIVDTICLLKNKAEESSDILKRMGLKKNEYFLATIHRQENVDSEKYFSNILSAFSELKKVSDFPVMYPIHPRSQKRLKEIKLKLPKNVIALPPLGFFDFLNLEINAALIFTDSGGVQEEACVLGVPCVTLREETERQESVLVGANIVAGRDRDKILLSAKKILKSPRNWSNPFGDGKTGKRIIGIITRNFKNK